MKKIEVIQNVLEANEIIASRNRQLLDKHKVLVVNIMSAPGAGKTSLILETLTRLKDRLNIGVIEGDVASTVDAEKVQSEAKAVVQINTRNMPESCSLMAAMIESALKDMPLNDIDLILIENVGNLICPAEFALGEHKRVVISSLPEGDDKPIKYPLIFVDADAVVINKMDLLPHVDFDIGAFRRSIAGLNPDVEVFELSSKTGEGVEKWCSWILEQTKADATR
ncbi:MAG: hydrogenase nickel incorporation protein HypB [Dehalococcoidia bacterium]|nr:hydrogenase nickel incorporation protein HypB [Dehalococcoidia bacterium]MDH4299812.1 hydrogenase nickel incorporation protein HypB [Dehalococcoidia bacterium]MDH4367633.1 hydrogenase nickel incorporation protein HypB [Dehalococcoidia bacterium]